MKQEPDAVCGCWSVLLEDNIVPSGIGNLSVTRSVGQRGWELWECIKSAVILPHILISFRGKGRKEEGKERKSFRQHVL